MTRKNTGQVGFTIVELLIVIVVIGIIASIAIVGYNGTQKRARDSSRLTDMNTLAKSIDIYKSFNGVFPPKGGTAGVWARSNTLPTSYITDLAGDGKTISSLPIDPLNNAKYMYSYFIYSPGAYGCDASRGRYYVLMMLDMETIGDTSRHPNSPGFVCSGRDWSTEASGAAWVQGGYEN